MNNTLLLSLSNSKGKTSLTEALTTAGYTVVEDNLTLTPQAILRTTRPAVVLTDTPARWQGHKVMLMLVEPLQDSEPATTAPRVSRHPPFDQLIYLLAQMIQVQVYQQAVEEWTIRLAVFSELSRYINALTSSEKMLETIVDVLSQMFHYAQVGVAFVEKRQLVFHAERSLNTTIPTQTKRTLPLDQGIIGWVARHGVPLLVNDVRHDPRYVPHPRVSGIRSELAVPILIRERVVGVLDVQHRQPNAFTFDDQRLLQSLADQLGVAIEKIRLLEAQQRQAEHLAFLNEVAREIVNLLDEEEVAWRVVRMIHERLACHAAILGLIEGNEIICRAGVGATDTLPIGHREPIDEKSAVGWVVLNARRLLIPDTKADPRCSAPLTIPGTRSELILPLQIRGNVVGILDVQQDHPEGFRAETIQLLESLGSQVAGFLENTRLFAQRQRIEETLHALNAAALAVQQVLAPEEIFATVARELQYLGFQTTVLQIAPDRSCSLLYTSYSPRIQHAMEERLNAEISSTRFHLDVETAELFIDRREALFVESVRDTIYLFEEGKQLSPQTTNHLDQILGSPKVALIPLVVDDVVEGILALTTKNLQQDDLPSLIAFANQLSVTISNSRLYASARRVDELELLNRLSYDLSLYLEVEYVAETLLRYIATALEIDTGLIALQTDPNQPPHPLLQWTDGEIEQPPEKTALLPRIHLGAERQAVLIEPRTAHLLLTPDEQENLQAVGIQTLLLLSLTTTDHSLGTLALGRRAGRPTFTEQEIELAQAMVGQASIAMENAQLYTELRRFTEELERSREQLIRSEKLAATGRLAASVAHEINNPLQAVRNCLELALDDLNSGQIPDRDYLEVAHQEIIRIAQIVQRMLDLYRPSEAKPLAVDLKAVIDDVLTLTRYEMERHKITSSLKYHEDRPLIVVGRPDRLKQVFLNIAFNAIQAMPDGGELHIAIGRTEDNQIAQVIFTDTGCGIPEEHLPLIFDPFFTTKEEGTGLGLSISYEIIQQYGGTIEIQSEIGRGTTVRVLLPLTQTSRGEE